MRVNRTADRFGNVNFPPHILEKGKETHFHQYEQDIAWKVSRNLLYIQKEHAPATFVLNICVDTATRNNPANIRAYILSGIHKHLRIPANQHMYRRDADFVCDFRHFVFNVEYLPLPRLSPQSPAGSNFVVVHRSPKNHHTSNTVVCRHVLVNDTTTVTLATAEAA